MTIKQKIGTGVIVVFLIVAAGLAGRADVQYYQQQEGDYEDWLELMVALERAGEREQDIMVDDVVYENLDLVSKQWGIASWYDYKIVDETDESGRFTGRSIGVPCFRATERCYTEDKVFAASRKFERGDVLMVTNIKTGVFVNVIVTDYVEHPKRVVDLTSFAFSKLAPLEVGLIDVEIKRIGNIGDARVIDTPEKLQEFLKGK